MPSNLYANCGNHQLPLQRDVDLRSHSTMRVGGSATWFAEARSVGDVKCAYAWAAERNISVCTIGSGSNIIWSDAGYEGLVLKNVIPGFQITLQKDDRVEIWLGAGEILDQVVDQTTTMGLTGMECLSLIPGTCGGAIIQNSGAYGKELSQVLQCVEVFDTTSREVLILQSDACNLGYRSSIFKNEEPGRYVILGFTVGLIRGLAERPSYPALLAMLGERKLCTPAEVRSAVIRIRQSKLPDPAIVPNCGSFFTNPVIQEGDLSVILSDAQAPLHMVDPGRYKVPAAWLIERCGLKDHKDAQLGFGTWAEQPLVLYATCPSSCTNLLRYSGMVERVVRERFGVILEREPVLMGR